MLNGLQVTGIVSSVKEHKSSNPTRWTVTAREDKPKHGGGIVILRGVCRNQDDVVVAEADGKILVRARA